MKKRGTPRKSAWGSPENQKEPYPFCEKGYGSCSAYGYHTSILPMLQSPARHVSRKRLERRNGTFGCGNSAFAYVPRAGDDRSRSQSTRNTPPYFNPRPPHGGRRSTGAENRIPPRISTHVPRTGDDIKSIRIALIQINFNPRPPHGGRRLRLRLLCRLLLFQPTSPVRGTM